MELYIGPESLYGKKNKTMEIMPKSIKHLSRAG